MSNIDWKLWSLLFLALIKGVYLLMERKKKKLCIENRLYIKIMCHYSIKGVKTCVRLPGGNRIISHVSVCKVLKQSATIVELI